MVQWLRLHASNVTDVGLILGPELRSCMPRGVARKKNYIWAVDNSFMLETSLMSLCSLPHILY